MENEQDHLESAATAEAGRLLEAHAWTSARFVMAEIRSNSAAFARFTRPDGTVGSVSPRLIARRLRVLRAAMADPARGAWFSVRLELVADGGAASVSCNRDERVDYNRLDPDDVEPPTGEPTRPGVEEWIDELAKHPRSPEHVPAWLQALVAGDDTGPGDGVALERAVAATPTWPPALERLAASPRWSAVFDAVSEELVGALHADSPATELLHREVDDRALEQVGESATGPLLRRFVSDETTCAALAAEIDGPNGPAGAEDDVMDAITDLVDWQLARRFER